MRNKIFSSVLILFLFMGVFILLKPQKDVLVVERRQAHTLSEISINENIGNDLENVLKDQMPLRNSVIKLYNLFKRKSTSLLERGEGVEIINSEVIKTGDYYALNPRQYEYTDSVVISNRDALNRIVNEYDIPVYVYKPTRIEETDLIDLPGVYEDLEGIKASFLEGLDGRIVYKELKLESVSDYERMYYKSDHHWNNVGSYQGYSDIIKMMQKDFRLENPRELLDDYIFEYPFVGFMGCSVGNDDIYDYMTDNYLAINEGSYDYYENGEKALISDMKYNYLENTETYKYSAYDVYYGFNHFERIFDFHEEERPNVLIFADSFINCIKEPLASHFNKTVILDMRSAPEDFSLDYYMKKYDIDAILVLEFYGDLYFNGDMLIKTE